MRRAVLALTMMAVPIAAACAGCNANPSRSDDRAPAVSTSSVSVRPAVAWPATSSIDERALVSLTRDGAKSEAEVRALVSRSPVPVLVPKDLRLASPSLVVEGEYFALTGRADGATISLQGTRAAHRYEGVEPAAGNRELRAGGGASGATRGFVSVNEGIRTASWIENGAAYSVDVECADARDARCQDDAFLLDVVGQLTYVGGSGR